jgi:hypothetical protein
LLEALYLGYDSLDSISNIKSTHAKHFHLNKLVNYLPTVRGVFQIHPFATRYAMYPIHQFVNLLPSIKLSSPCSISPLHPCNTTSAEPHHPPPIPSNLGPLDCRPNLKQATLSQPRFLGNVSEADASICSHVVRRIEFRMISVWAAKLVVEVWWKWCSARFHAYGRTVCMQGKLDFHFQLDNARLGRVVVMCKFVDVGQAAPFVVNLM